MELVCFSGHASVIRILFLGDKILVGSCGENAIDPCLSVLVSGGGESCTGQLLCVQAIGGFLRGILPYWKSAFDSLGPMRGESSVSPPDSRVKKTVLMVRVEARLVGIRIGMGELCHWHIVE